MVEIVLGVLLCTDVAARGLDLPLVNSCLFSLIETTFTVLYIQLKILFCWAGWRIYLSIWIQSDPYDMI